MNGNESSPEEDPFAAEGTFPEYRYLDLDIHQSGAAIQQNSALLTALGDTSDPAKHTFHSITLGLAWDVRDYAAGVAILLPNRPMPPVVAAQRALWETVANLRYLVGHSERYQEALIYQAYTYIKEREDYPEDAPLVAERHLLLARMPKDCVAEAGRRAKSRPWTWSGLKIVELAETAGLTNFRRLYATLSAQVHAHRVGNNVRFGDVRGDQQDLTIGRGLSDVEVEINANFARRGLKAAMGALWSTVDSPQFVVGTPDPDVSRVRQ